MFYFQLSADQKSALKDSWQIIYSNMGRNLCYVGGGAGCPAGGSAESADDGAAVAETFLRNDARSHGDFLSDLTSKYFYLKEHKFS